MNIASEFSSAWRLQKVRFRTLLRTTKALADSFFRDVTSFAVLLVTGTSIGEESVGSRRISAVLMVLRTFRSSSRGGVSIMVRAVGSFCDGSCNCLKTAVSDCCGSWSMMRKVLPASLSVTAIPKARVVFPVPPFPETNAICGIR